MEKKETVFVGGGDLVVAGGGANRRGERPGGSDLVIAGGVTLSSEGGVT